MLFMNSLHNENTWQVTASEYLQDVEGFRSYPTAKPVELSEKDYDLVQWDRFLIRAADERKLVTEQLSICIALCARGYSSEGKLTHVGLSHQFLDKVLSEKFMKAMRKKVGGRIEFFLAGGGADSSPYLQQIRKVAKGMENVEIVDDVAQQIFKKFSFLLGNRIYTALSRINQIYFDEQCNPRLHIDFKATGLSPSQFPEKLNLKEDPF